MRKLIETNKDIIFLLFISIWLFIGIIVAFTDINIWKFNAVMVILFSILCIFKVWNHKFNNWLNKEI